MSEPITPTLLLRAYSVGVFPMAETSDRDEVFWVDPTRRGILPLDGFHLSRSLARAIRQAKYDIRVDHDFEGVVRGCADRPETWINAQIFSLYQQLHALGVAHSVEVWEQERLVGGVYGVVLGGAFFGESMFSRRRDTSKLALAYLVARLRVGGFILFDTQFVTDHLRSLGAVEITRNAYHKRLADALAQEADFFAQPLDVAPSAVMQACTQTS